MECDYAVAPGLYAQEMLDEKFVTRETFLDGLGFSDSELSAFLVGNLELTESLAGALAEITPIPADAWVRLEEFYRSELERLSEIKAKEEFAEEQNNANVVSYLRKAGVVSSTMKHKQVVADQILAFYDLDRVDSFAPKVDRMFAGEYKAAALKVGRKYELDKSKVMAWIQVGRSTKAAKVHGTIPYSEQGLRDVLPELKRICQTPDETLPEQVSKLLASVGVLFQIVPPPKSLPLYGMTTWVDEKFPVIQQTNRNKDDGHFIYTLFHEIGHILNDPRGETHLDFSSEKGRDSVTERKANQFANEVLLGGEIRDVLGRTSTESDVRKLAAKLEVAPSLIVMLQKRRQVIDRKRMHRLTVKLPSPDFSDIM